MSSIDLKPTNVFLAETTGGTVVKVLGSPAYMSPEQMMASPELDSRSDVWSMGALLYELLTGRLPFPGDSPFEMFAAVMSRPPVPAKVFVPERPSTIQSILSRCLRKSPAERYSTMRELAAALRSVT